VNSVWKTVLVTDGLRVETCSCFTLRTYECSCVKTALHASFIPELLLLMLRVNHASLDSSFKLKE
jgi:hypothetical protein